MNPTCSVKPIPMRLPCPECHTLHVDVGDFVTRPHHTHACQNCGNVWRPAVEPTVGVQFLPGFKNEPEKDPDFDHFDHVARVIRAMSTWTPECRAGLMRELLRRWPEVLPVFDRERHAALARAEQAEQERDEAQRLADKTSAVIADLEERLEAQVKVNADEAAMYNESRKQLYRQAVQAEAARDTLRAKLETAEKKRGEAQRKRDEIADTIVLYEKARAETMSDRDSLRAELDRAKPLIEAALSWFQDYDEEDIPNDPASRELWHAADAYEQPTKAEVDALSASTAGEEKGVADPAVAFFTDICPTSSDDPSAPRPEETAGESWRGVGAAEKIPPAVRK